MEVNTARDLAALIADRNDETILAKLRELGVDDSIEKIFHGMTQAFIPGNAAGQKAVIQWNVKVGDETHTYQLDVADGACRALKGSPQPPRVTLTVDAPMFLRIITGKQNPMIAVATGRLKVAGDVMFAMKQEGWFDKNWGG